MLDAFLILFLSNIVLPLSHFLQSVESSEVCRELQYVHKITGKALEGHVIKTIQVQHNDQCELSCFVELECISYNLGPLQVNGHTCELSKSDHLRHPDDFVTKPSYIYSGTKNSCSSSPCPNNATCLSLNAAAFQCLCPAGFTGKNCETGNSCQTIKAAFPDAPSGMYWIQTDSGLSKYLAYCDMKSFDGGWTMCYTTDNLVNLTAQVTYDENLPYGRNGYRTDCRNIQFREILFVDETTGDKAFFTYKINSTLVAEGNYGAQLPGLFDGGGKASTGFEYQLLICDIWFYSGFFVSVYYNNCFKRCDSWCGDLSLPYFRSAAISTDFRGVAFNVNGHRPLSNRLISVGLR